MDGAPIELPPNRLPEPAETTRERRFYRFPKAAVGACREGRGATGCGAISAGFPGPGWTRLLGVPMFVRLATPADAWGLSYLLVDLGYTLTADEVERGRAEPGTRVLVAEENDQVVGLLSMHTRRHFQLAGVVSSIDALVVGVSHRGNGVGRALVQEACCAAEQLGATFVDLNSNVARVDARRFYERLGFEVVSHHFRRPLAQR